MRRIALALTVLARSVRARCGAGRRRKHRVRHRSRPSHRHDRQSTRGNLCTGTAIARDLVLTAGHCVAPRRDLSRVPARHRAARPAAQERRRATRATIRRTMPSGRVTADVALLKLEGVLPADIFPTRARDAPRRRAGRPLRHRRLWRDGDRQRHRRGHAARRGDGRDRQARQPADPAGRSGDARRARRARRLHRRLRRTCVHRERRRLFGDRRGELVDRPRQHAQAAAASPA